ncbi:MAG: hypothetical protein IOC59_07760 [Methylobacterium sp.]|nr:hypothetical protein [Methylobacterium sp.]MCA3615102.1 hypothetical protein [Methylobacterium sp.]
MERGEDALVRFAPIKAMVVPQDGAKRFAFRFEGVAPVRPKPPPRLIAFSSREPVPIPAFARDMLRLKMLLCFIAFSFEEPVSASSEKFSRACCVQTEAHHSYLVIIACFFVKNRIPLFHSML